MAERSDKKYLTPSQKLELVQLVGENYSVLFNKKNGDASMALKRNEWQLIALKLNAMGPTKSTDGWMRCFTTLKAATKAKYVAQSTLNDIDHKIVQICNMRSLDVAREQFKKARRSYSRKATVDSQQEDGSSSSQMIATAQTEHGTQSNQIANIPIEQMGSYATTAQKRRLVKVVADNYSPLFGKISTKLGAGSLKDRIWALLTMQLNSLGPHKDVTGWQNCFNYLKSRTKEKLTFIRQYKMKNGCSPTHLKLSEIESEIIEMCDIDTLDGNSNVMELGFKISSAARVDRACPSSTVVSSMISEINGNASNEVNDRNVDPQQSLEVLCDEEPMISEINGSASNEVNDRNGDPQQSLEVLCDEEPMTMTHSTIVSPSPSCDNENEQEIIISNVRSLQDESAAVDEVPTYDSLMASAEMNEIRFARFAGFLPTAEVVRDEVLESDLQQEVESLSGSRRLNINENSQAESDMQIIPIPDPPPQRRGVEINNDKYVRPRPQINDEEDDDRGPRRNRLSVPLAVMAEESLELQRKGNSLLTEMVHILRQLRNRTDE